jgi:hypothetical protein
MANLDLILMPMLQVLHPLLLVIAMEAILTTVSPITPPLWCRKHSPVPKAAPLLVRGTTVVLSTNRILNFLVNFRGAGQSH